MSAPENYETFNRLRELRDAHWMKIRRENPLAPGDGIDEISLMMAICDLLDERWGLTIVAKQDPQPRTRKDP